MSDASLLPLHINAPQGLTRALVRELRRLDVGEIQAGHGIASFQGTLEMAYRIALWSRLANRLFLGLHEADIQDADDLYQAAHTFQWEDHFSAHNSLAIQVTGQLPGLDHSHYAALKIKDAIVDRFREQSGERPNIDTEQPDIRIHCHLSGGRARFSLDLSGDSLHKRGWRRGRSDAPLKENLAAGLLLLAGWPGVARAKGPLIDPMCGSGTLLIEAAALASDTAPNLQRKYFGFLAWKGHDQALWAKIRLEAHHRHQQGLADMPAILGYDIDEQALSLARSNIERAGFSDCIEVQQRKIEDFTITKTDHANDDNSDKRGLIISNPPYGLRLGDDAKLLQLHKGLGESLRQHCAGWKLALFTARPEMAAQLGLEFREQHELLNGSIETVLYNARVTEQAQAAEPAFTNRLRKNFKHLGKWARRENIECYRVYDRDLPEYAFAIDLYGEHIHIQEYAPNSKIDPVRAANRRGQAMASLIEVFGASQDHIHSKLRQRQKGRSQYTRQSQKNEFLLVQEGGLEFGVNLDDYLDTGLFLDHRDTRAMIRDMVKGKSFLNLFAYTGSVSVYAAAGGARQTTSVDMSYTYLDWAEQNMSHNGFDGPEHHFDQANCMEWLATKSETFDLIFLDPPSFSNSKRMEDTFDVQRDQRELLSLTTRRLNNDGKLIFSNNLRGFKLDPSVIADLKLKATDISSQTIPLDFKRHTKIHQCWIIEHI